MGKYSQSNEIKIQLEHFYNEFNQFENKLLKEHALTKATFTLLNNLIDIPKTIKKLSFETNLDKSTLSRQLDILVKKNLVIEIKNEDRRLRNVQLSEEGQNLQNRINQNLTQQWELIFQSWSDEEKQLLMVLLGRMNRSFQLIH
ncbi:MarR family winged helix-turn-helix transcriptional regulator [Carnobacterium divergens]|uniref:MarR family transcriptional regulator n=1 Tax=Carnobacterium divergens TaxID=2748 RepID=A0AAW8RA65_CARDV|nr:MarR family transcriptional regulator [Carnobacterium divergens]MDT1957792.1 MarR family transcriptional regulator [Carnobacterium divergens]MDT1973795.1 MarR family transcriptional regulator [Carnobacterium divergens]MDT1995044.1 MarR family transcriptional regulator [Carnobacterium divergens]MDT2010789.1 MarR family transcriptional regulator [Carnobacterium divergens]TFI64217.1 hypothetical protein CKN59_09545 [Carnobacterium divergens]